MYTDFKLIFTWGTPRQSRFEIEEATRKDGRDDSDALSVSGWKLRTYPGTQWIRRRGGKSEAQPEANLLSYLLGRHETEMGSNINPNPKKKKIHVEKWS